MLTEMMMLDVYTRLFETERQQDYPTVDALEAQTGYALDRQKLETAASVLACPVKVNPPNWQHGRVLYSFARHYAAVVDAEMTWLDIGTAKGFSALCLQWALDESGRTGQVWSVDVLDPQARVRRNTVAEQHGHLTLAETLAPWPEHRAIRFEQSTGINWLQRHPERVHLAFIDGKHDGDVVLKEGKLLADRQEQGDVVVFDDVQIPGIRQAIKNLDPYVAEYIAVKPERVYALGLRR